MHSKSIEAYFRTFLTNCRYGSGWVTGAKAGLASRPHFEERRCMRLVGLGGLYIRFRGHRAKSALAIRVTGYIKSPNLELVIAIF